MTPQQAKIKHEGLFFVEKTMVLSELRRSFDAFWLKHDPQLTSYVWFEKPACLKSVNCDNKQLLAVAMREFERELVSLGWQIVTTHVLSMIEIHLNARDQVYE